MLNKVALWCVAGFCVFFLAACVESQQEQSHTEHLSRAKIYQEQGQYKAALIEYKNAVKKANGDIEPFVQYATLLNILGQHPSAVALLDQVKGEKNEAYHLELVRAYQGMNKYMSAQKILDQQLKDGGLRAKLLRAHNAAGTGELDLALSLFNELTSDPYVKDEALVGKAVVLARTGKTQESLDVLQQVDSASEANIKANILKAGIQISQQQLEEAESTLSEALAGMRNTDVIEPEKVTVLERLSYVLTRQGRSNEAYIYTKILAEAFPGANEVNAKFQTAIEKMDAGEMDEAKSILNQILKDYPSYSRASQMLGIISYIQGDIESASKYLSDSVDPEVANDMTRHIYAATNLKLNDSKRVLEILEPGIEKTTVPATLALYGLAAISDKQYEKGEKALLKALELDKSNVRIHLALANFYRNKPTPDVAKERQQLTMAYEKAPTDKNVITDMMAYLIRNEGVASANNFIETALKKHPRDYATNLLAGSFVAGQQDFKKALGLFEAAIKSDPKGDELITAVFAKGRAQLALNDTVAAEQTFAELIRLSPADPLGYKGMLSVYLLKNDFEAGARKLESYAQELNQLAPYVVLVEAAVTRKELDSAKAYYSKAGKLDVNEQELAKLGEGIRYVEAVMAMQTQDFPAARTHIADLLAEDPENIRLLSFLVDLEMQAGQLNEANKILAQIENINPNHPVVDIFKADLALANKDLKTAEFHLSNAWKNTPSDPVAEKLFKVLGALGEKSKQQKHLEYWLEVLPGSAAATLYQAIDLQQNRQANKAMEAYEKVLQVAPDNVMALNNLGWIYFEKNDPRALDLLKKAVELAPENAAVLDSYGWVLAKRGNKAEGLPYLEKAHQLAPNEAEIKSHLDEVKAMK